MADIKIIQADNGEYNLIVDGEWYANGSYEYVTSMQFSNNDDYNEEEA